MIWMILAIGLVAGACIGLAVWLIPQIGSNDRIVEPYQNGSLYKKFREDLDIDRPHPDSYRE